MKRDTKDWVSGIVIGGIVFIITSLLGIFPYSIPLAVSAAAIWYSFIAVRYTNWKPFFKSSRK